jgi:hypothetical protein
MARPRPALTLALFLLAFALGALVAFTSGCGQVTSRRIIEAQTPGGASGAGASLTGPANSATASTQTAERTMGFYVPPVAVPRPAVPMIQIETPGLAALPMPPAPAWVQERVQTTIGAHQDASGMMKAAAAMDRWGTVKWMGLLCILVGVGGLLWSAGHNEGYPLIFWKLIGGGVFFIFVAENPAWLLLLLIPLGFYAVQKFNLLRIP